jgi:diadenosine tetraphosphate (Ap4A) HIT family hydrolase
MCELCETTGGILLWKDEFLRIVRVEMPDYIGFCRVILQRHISEMTDLSFEERNRFMNAIWAVETALRNIYKPTKINLASLGNIVPHLHWHVIPRFSDDPHFPQPIWSPACRELLPRFSVTDETLCNEILTHLNTMYCIS